jgi:TM2 domain-containing membrane protein YozV
MQQSCQFTEGHSFQATLLLAVFLGMFGADRFYLGYYAIGLLKFCTFGFMLVGQLLDIILIVTQVLRPASGAFYVIDYFGPKMNITSLPT